VTLVKLAKELWAHHANFNQMMRFEKCNAVLKKNENERFETWIKD
jgi:hypothetical protein